jgi:hypothetical protein
MLIRKPLIFFTLVFAIVVVFAVSEVLAQQCGPGENTADYQCNDGVKGNYTVRTVTQFPTIAPCGDPYPDEDCSTYTWNISPTGLSHFNLIVDRSFEEKIVNSNATKTSTDKWLDCTGRGDQSQGASLFGQFLTWHCFMRFDCKDPDTGNYVDPFVTLRGEFAATPTDWYVKQAACNYGDDCDFQGDFGITQGLAEICGPEATGVVTSSRICVNLPGTEKIGDEAHYWFFRNDDAANCIDTGKDFYICPGTCPDSFSDDPPSACQKLEGTVDALHIVGTNLVGTTCPNELFKQSFTNSPFYYYETWAGDYHYEACYDYGTSGGTTGWTDVGCCTGKLNCD